MKRKRFYAEEVNGKGYVFDSNFSTNVPIAVETSIETARAQVDKFNREEQKEEKIWS